MKAEYRRSMRFASGKMGKFVHIKYKKGGQVVIRRLVKPKPGEHNQLFGKVKKNIAVIWSQCSEGFKDDLKNYSIRRKEFYSAEDIPPPTNYAHFIRFLYNCQKDNPEIDLADVSKEELETAGIPTNVADTMRRGILAYFA